MSQWNCASGISKQTAFDTLLLLCEPSYNNISKIVPTIVLIEENFNVL